MVIGSGPIVIGQAAEFDYAGVQACRALREEGHRVVLVNSNPATIMTDPEIADAVYLEPLTVASLERIIARERPEALLPTLGGQTGLNLAVELAEAGVIEKYGVELLGTPLDTIKLAEDRERFKAKMIEIGEPVPRSLIVTDVSAIGYVYVLRSGSVCSPRARSPGRAGATRRRCCWWATTSGRSRGRSSTTARRSCRTPTRCCWCGSIRASPTSR